MSKVLLTGYLGFLGSHVLDALIEKGHEVYGIDNGSTGRAENVAHHDFDVFMASGEDIVMEGRINGVDKICERFKPDTILHLAAQPSLLVSERDPKHDAAVNIGGTINVIQAAKKWGAFLVFTSTSAVYNPGAVMYNERKTSINPNTPYGISKAAAEMYVRKLMPENQWRILRLGNVYGPRQMPLGDNQLVPRLLGHIFNGKDFEIYGDGSDLRDYIYVKDVAKAILSVVEMKVKGIINIATGKSFYTSTVVEKICKLAGYTEKIPQDKTLHNNERSSVVMSVDRMNQILGHRPMVSLDDGLKTTVDWWKDNMGAT